MKIHIGCSSYREGNWKGIFYPDDLPQSRWFDYYAEHFGTYEMNGTFYKFPTAKQMAKWRRDAPENFLFSIKAPRLITHFKKMQDCGREIGEFYQASDALGEKLGAVLFQFPAQFSFSAERLEQLIESIEPNHPNVFEFRHESWWRSEVYAALNDASICFCGVSYPKLDESVIKTSSMLYYRFHGNRSLFRSGYPDGELYDFADAVKAHHPETAFIYFNNTATKSGIENALKLKGYF